MTVLSTSYILKLNEVSRSDINYAGAKAAHLGELTRIGFPVPDGSVLTIKAFADFLAVNNFTSNSSS